MDGAFKNQIITAVKPIFLSSLVDKIKGFGQVSALTLIQHLLSSYGVIEKIDLKENAVKTMGPYSPAEPLIQMIEQLEKGREFARAGGQTISDATIMSKGMTLLAQTISSITTSDSGKVRPRTRRRGPNTSDSSTEPTESRYKSSNNRR